MEKKDFLKKQELAEELGMKFDEASELFSEETLETMKMMNCQGAAQPSKTDVTVNGACPNVGCPSINVCPNLDIICDDCLFCTTTAPLPKDPPKLEEGCSIGTFPPPPTIQQDAICWQPTYPHTTK